MTADLNETQLLSESASCPWASRPEGRLYGARGLKRPPLNHTNLGGLEAAVSSQAHQFALTYGENQPPHWEGDFQVAHLIERARFPAAHSKSEI